MSTTLEDPTDHAQQHDPGEGGEHAAEDAAAAGSGEQAWLRRLRRVGNLQVAGGVAADELLQFTRMLAVHANAGVSLVEGLDTLADSSSDPRLSAVAADIASRVRRGERLAAAFAAHGEVFDPLYVATLQAGEATGEIGYNLDQLARHIAAEGETRHRITSLAIYPLIVLALAGTAALVLTAVVFPRLMMLFSMTPEQLPWWPATLLAVSELVRTTWPLLVGGAAIGAGAVAAGLRTEGGRQLRDRLVLRVPLVRSVARSLIHQRFCLSMASLLRAGVNLPDAMEVAAAGVGNHEYRVAVAAARSEVLRGERLSSALAHTELFDASVVQLVRTGEAAGRMDEQLEVIGEFYSEEAHRQVDRAARVAEPMLLLVASTGVALVAIALVQVLYGSYEFIPGF